MRKLPIIGLLILCVLNTSCTSVSYLSQLIALRGMSYWEMQCSTYITEAKGFRHCGAGEFWNNGCGGALATVAEAPSYQAIDYSVLRAGDVLAFHGVHVAAYVGDGRFFDSDPTHGGVGPMTPDAIHNDTWFSGKVKILRWKN